jgi:hypothetical protein
MNTKIVPVAVYPSLANTLMIRSIALGPAPQYYYELQNVVVVPPVAEQLEPTTGEVLIAAQPETQQVTMLKNGNVSMTENQWNSWSETVDDTEYQLDCIALNLGLVRA